MAGTCTRQCMSCNCSCQASGAGNHPKCPQCQTCKGTDDHTRKPS